MKKNNVIFASMAMGIFFSLLLASCSLGLDPSWKNNKPVFSLDFSTSLLGKTTGSRALVRGGGILYIRTIGGPERDTGNFYGPFTISQGSIFSTTEIPAGTYQGMCVIYAEAQPDSSRRISWNGSNYTFLEFMNLPTGEFLTATSTRPFVFNDFFDSNASGNIIPNVNITPGRENTIQLTLVPLVTTPNKVNLSETENWDFSSVGSKKEFIALDGLSAGTLLCSIELYAESATVGLTALYDSRGKLLQVWNPGAMSRTYSIPTGQIPSVLYFYMEYSGDGYIEFSIEPIIETNGSVDFQNLSGMSNMTMRFMLFDQNPESEANPVAVGHVVLDENGTGSVEPLRTVGGAVDLYKIAENTTYYIYGFVDMGGFYQTSNPNAAAYLANVGTVIPLTGDYILQDTDGPLPIISDAEGVITIISDGLTEMTMVQYFISAAGSGTGKNPADSCKWAQLATNIGNGVTYPVNIYITDDITVSDSLNILSSVVMSSWGENHTITLGNITDGSPFNVNTTTGSLTLENLTITASSNLTVPAFNVVNFGTLVLEDSTLNGMVNAVGDGGAVYLKNAKLYMNSSNINNSSASHGGGIYAQSTSDIYIDNSTGLTGNTAFGQGYGCGIYLENNARIYKNIQPPELLTTEIAVTDWAPNIKENSAGGNESNVYFAGP